MLDCNFKNPNYYLLISETNRGKEQIMNKK